MSENEFETNKHLMTLQSEGEARALDESQNRPTTSCFPSHTSSSPFKIRGRPPKHNFCSLKEVSMVPNMSYDTYENEASSYERYVYLK